MRHPHAGVRKHCRKSHAEWLREVDLEKANSGCRWAAYCTRQTITDGHDPRTTPVGCKRAREIMADGGLLPPMAAGAGTSLLKERSENCLLYTSPSPRDQRGSRMPSSA